MQIIKGIVKSILISILTIGIVGSCLWGYVRYVEPNLLRASRYQVEVPEEVVPCRIVFFTDTHLGDLYPQENLEKIVAKINSQQPDLVIFGGDFLDHYARDRQQLDLQWISQTLAKIEAPYGKYAVYGNHDYGGGAERIYESMMTEGGFQVLDDSNVLIDALNVRIIGFDDYLIGHTNPALYNLKSETYNVIVSHEPDVAEFITLPRAGVMLSGHSHGGQVRLPVITKKIFPKGARKYVRGYYKDAGKEGNLPLYVSTGIGVTVYPVRFLNIPEIMILDLQPR